jgi:hypothetical protein
MKYESYDAVRISDDLSSFDFLSKGHRGDLLKQIVFEPFRNGTIYQLVFGNLVAENEIDDFSINDNGDRNKILATVVQVVDNYTKRYPERMIYFRGSTPSRTRLYRMAIGLNLEEFSLTFDIYGETPNGIVPFCKNLEVVAFLIKRKSFDHPFTTI